MIFREISAADFAKFAASCPTASFTQSKEMLSRYQKQGREYYLVGVASDFNQDHSNRKSSSERSSNRKNSDKKLVLVALVVKIYERAGKKIFSAPLGPLISQTVSGFTTTPLPSDAISGSPSAASSPDATPSTPNISDVLPFFTREVKKFLRQKGGIVFQISPNIVARERDTDNNIIDGGVNNLSVKHILQRSGYKYLGEYEQAKWTYVLDLTPFYTDDKDARDSKKPSEAKHAGSSKRASGSKKLSQKQREDKLLMHFRQTCRLSIRYATERYHLKVRALKCSELPLFKQLVDQAGNYHGFSSHSLEYYEQMYDAYGKNVKFLVAETTKETPPLDSSTKTSTSETTTDSTAPVAGIPVAAAMFILSGTEIIYLSSGSDRKYAKFCGSHLLQWYILKFALKNGYKKYNFWGTQPDFEPGVYKFKKGFRGQMEELLGSFALPLDVLGWLYLLRIRPAETRILE